MKITDLNIDGFGVWNRLSRTELPDTIAVFYGPNEAGKTTLLQFIRTVLYGFSSERRARYLPPVYGGSPGGSLHVAASSGRYEIHRRGPRAGGKEKAEPGGAVAHDPNLGDVTVLAARGARQGKQLLSALLGGVDEATFNNVFAVGLREIQELGTLDDTEAADQLYKLTSGLDRVSLVDVMRQLDAARQRLLASDERPGEIARLLAERRRLQAAVEEHAGVGRHWMQLAAQLASVDQEAAQAEGAIARLEHEGRVIETALHVREPWARRAEVEQRLGELEPLPSLPDHPLERLETLNAQIKERRAIYQDLKSRRGQARQEAAALPIHRALVSQASRIEALSEHAPWIASLERQIGQLNQEAAALEQELSAQFDALGLPDAVTLDNLPDMAAKASAMLKRSAKLHHEEAARLRQAKTDRQSSRQEIEAISEQLRAALAPHGGKKLQEVIEEAGRVVAQLRRRAQAEERVAQLHKHRGAISAECSDLVEQQVLPSHVLGMLGAIFVVAVTLILTGIFGGVYFGLSGVTGFLLAIFGAGGIVAALASKAAMEREAYERLEAAKQRLVASEDQITAAERERAELDRALPRGHGTLEERLASAERELHKLEELLPLEARRQAAAHAHRASGEKARKAAGMVEHARLKWKNALRSAGLPDTMSLQQVRELNDRCQRIAESRKRLDEKRAERDQRRAEIKSVSERLAKLWESVEMRPASDEPRDQIRQLVGSLEQQRQMVERRRDLSRVVQSLRRELAQAGRELETLVRQRRKLLVDCGVEDDAGLRYAVSRLAEGLELREERRLLSEQIHGILGGRVDVAEVGELLEGREAKQLERRWELAQRRLEEEQKRLGLLRERRGETAQEMKTLSDDQRLERARLELSCVERRLEEAISEWRTLAVATLLLESIRQVYETQRQPETLAEASHFLDELTEGQYVRIWTPLGEHALRVDDAEGRSLSVDLLSSGTREAVFLSLRLALAGAYARRGASLPLVLDDVLVNFDSRRARAAARVFHRFAAEGVQMLIFTCHEHITEMFAELDIEVRELPERAGRGAGQVVRRTSRPFARPLPVLELAEPLVEEEMAPAPEEEPITLEFEPAAPEEFEPAPVLLESAEEPEVDEYELEEPLAVERPQPLVILDDEPEPVVEAPAEPEPSPAPEPVAAAPAEPEKIEPAPVKQTPVAEPPVDEEAEMLTARAEWDELRGWWEQTGGEASFPLRPIAHAKR